MDPITISAIATAVIPFVTAGIKKLFTKNLPEEMQSGVHAVIPLVLGILSSGLFTYQQTHDVWVSIAAGLGSGGVASSVRDIDKNVTKIIETLYGLIKGK